MPQAFALRVRVGVGRPASGGNCRSSSGGDGCGGGSWIVAGDGGRCGDDAEVDGGGGTSRFL